MIWTAYDAFTDGLRAMFTPKTKSFYVVLDGEVGGHAVTMQIIGCIDMDECVRYANKAKDKGMKIREVKEIIRTR